MIGAMIEISVTIFLTNLLTLRTLFCYSSNFSVIVMSMYNLTLKIVNCHA